jgi:hypothetical protein
MDEHILYGQIRSHVIVYVTDFCGNSATVLALAKFC